MELNEKGLKSHKTITCIRLCISIQFYSMSDETDGGFLVGQRLQNCWTFLIKIYWYFIEAIVEIILVCRIMLSFVAAGVSLLFTDQVHFALIKLEYPAIKWR